MARIIVRIENVHRQLGIVETFVMTGKQIQFTLQRCRAPSIYGLRRTVIAARNCIPWAPASGAMRPSLP